MRGYVSVCLCTLSRLYEITKHNICIHLLLKMAMLILLKVTMLLLLLSIIALMCHRLEGSKSISA